MVGFVGSMLMSEFIVELFRVETTCVGLKRSMFAKRGDFPTFQQNAKRRPDTSM